MNRIPTWTKVIFGVGTAAGLSVVVKDKLAAPPFEEPVKLDGKVAIVTGANRGIGFEVAKGLAARGAKVYLACRDKDRCAAAREDIFLATENKEIYCRYCDLGSFESIKRFVRRLQKDEEKVDILVNNAAIMWGEREYTQDGIESQLGVNYMGHFLLTNLLIDKIKNGAPSRIVNLTSTSHFKGKINVKDLNSAEDYDDSRAYNQSKLANVLFTRELARRLEGTGVVANAVHPGVVDSDLGKPAMSSITKAFMFVMTPFIWPFIQAPRHGAQSVLYVALHPALEKTTGQYFSMQKVVEPSQEAKNDQLALWLWLTSEKWTKLESARMELGVSSLALPGQTDSQVSIPDMKQKAKAAKAVKAVNSDIAGSLSTNPLTS